MRAAAYSLTPAGQELEPALRALGRWGWRTLGAPRKGDRTYLDGALIALKRRYCHASLPGRAPGLACVHRPRPAMTRDGSPASP